MSKVTQLQLLKEEENVLVKLATKLNDQMNRLKVEELALLNKIGSSNDTPGNRQRKPAETESNDQNMDEASTLNMTPLLDLDLLHNTSAMGQTKEEEYEDEEDDEDEDMEHDQLTAFMKQLEKNAGHI